MARHTDAASFLAAQKVWSPKPAMLPRPDGGEVHHPAVPKSRRTAGRRFRCSAHECVLTGQNCAARWLATAGNRPNNFSNGPNAVRVWTGHCADCPAGKARVDLLGVTPADMQADIQGRRERGRRAYLASLPDRVERANAAIADSYGETNVERTDRRREVEFRRRVQAATASGGGDLLPRLTPAEGL